jgi:hypothetical protein
VRIRRHHLGADQGRRDRVDGDAFFDSWPKTVVKAVSVAAVYGILWGAPSFGVALVAASG